MEQQCAQQWLFDGETGGRKLPFALFAMTLLDCIRVGLMAADLLLAFVWMRGERTRGGKRSSCGLLI